MIQCINDQCIFSNECQTYRIGAEEEESYPAPQSKYMCHHFQPHLKDEEDLVKHFELSQEISYGVENDS